MDRSQNKVPIGTPLQCLFIKEVRRMGEMTKVAKAKDLAPGKAMCVEVAGQKVALFNIDGSYYAIGDSCTHRGGPLSEGEVDGKVVTCPLHGAQFDVTTGGVLGPPAGADVPGYRVDVEGDDIKIESP